MTGINPLLRFPELPHFDHITPDHAGPAIQHLIESASNALADLERNARPSWDGCMRPLLALTEPLEYAWGIISHLQGVMNTPAWRTAHAALQPLVVAFSARIAQSEPVYHALRQLRDPAAWHGFGEAEQRLIDTAMRAAEQAGVGLEAAQRARLLALREQLAADASLFSNHVLDATRTWSLTLHTAADADGLPASLRTAAAAAQRAGHTGSSAADGPWVITLEAPLFIPFMQYSRRRDLRETLYRAYVTRAATGDNDNTPLIARLLAHRAETACILGYPSFAALTLQSRMARTPDAVDRLIGRLHTAARPAAEREHAELETFAHRHGQSAPLMHWDIAFWSEQMRKTRFTFNDEDLRPYFQFPIVLAAMFKLARRLFGLEITPADGKTAVWHPDVRFFEVFNEHGVLIAGFYLDPYSRPETKRGGAWMDTARSRQRDTDGTRVPPVAYLICNQTLPTADRASLMTLTEVTTLFHEFGHVLQHLLTTVDIPAASGIHNIEWDAIELPSQFMENWCYHRPVLLSMARHVETGAPLPAALAGQVCKARTFRAGSTVLRQLLFSAIDMELHHRFTPGGTETPDEVKNRVATAFSVLPALPEDRFLCGFSHIFAGGYAAGYYSYKWAEVLSADAFAAFEEAGLDDPEVLSRTGRRFRDTVLASGGSRHPMDCFRAFRGRDPDPDALLRQEGLMPVTETH